MIKFRFYGLYFFVRRENIATSKSVIWCTVCACFIVSIFFLPGNGKLSSICGFWLLAFRLYFSLLGGCISIFQKIFFRKKIFFLSEHLICTVKIYYQKNLCTFIFYEISLLSYPCVFYFFLNFLK